MKRLDRHRHREGRDRRLGRARLDAGARSSRCAPSTGSACRAANILGYTLPGFGTSRHTLDNAHELMRALGISAERDRHPRRVAADARAHRPPGRAGRARRTTSPSRTCRPASARRTCSGSPTCTARWCSAPATCPSWRSASRTYGVGDHMSHYNVNASVPKTLIQHLIRWLVAHARSSTTDDRAVLDRIVDTRDLAGAGAGLRRRSPSQSSEAVVGPYELQDFNLYYLSRFGYRPSKVAFLAHARLGRSRARRAGRTRCPSRSGASTTSPRSALARGVPAAVLPGQPVQALGDAERARRSDPAARCRRAATGARRVIRRPRCGSTNCGRTCPGAERERSPLWDSGAAGPPPTA